MRLYDKITGLTSTVQLTLRNPDLSRQRNHGTVVIEVNDDHSKGGRASQPWGSPVCCRNNEPGATK